MKYLEPQHMLGLRVMSKKGLDAYGDYYTWLKHNRKQMNAGTLKPERVEKFKKLLELTERYRRKNQYE